MNVTKEHAALVRMSVSELQHKHLEVFGEPNNSRNKAYLVKRIIWRMQANEYGDLTERALQRATELAQDSALRTTIPKTPTQTKDGAVVVRSVNFTRSDELPPGTCLRRTYKEQEIIVQVLQKGFEFEGEIYRSLSAIAKKVTGAHWNGKLFFGLSK